MVNNNCDFTAIVKSYMNYGFVNVVFTYGNVRLLEINGKIVYLWQDAKGNVCYSFTLEDKEYFTTTITKLGNILTNHFQCSIEAVNTIKESLKKVTLATTGLTKALSDAQSYNDYVAYVQAESEKNHEIQQYEPKLNQEQLHKDIINLSVYQLEQNKNTYYISINELPIIHKEEFRPDMKEAFFTYNGLVYKNRYIAPEYMTKSLLPNDINNSFIFLFIFIMAKKDLGQAMNILVWLVNSFNSTKKLPYILALHSENDIYMRLFYEEIVVPLLNPYHCERIASDNLDEKSLSKQLNEKVIYNFHNATAPIVLDVPAKEFTNRLIHKDDYKLNNNIITTVANTLVTSTTKYIPLIAKDVPSLLVNVESDLESFCKGININSNYYTVAKFIEYDLDNFVYNVRNIDMNTLNNPYNLQFYTGDTDILDGDVDILEVFESSIYNKDKVFFEILKTKIPKLYRNLVADFEKDRVNRKNLIEYFTAMFGEDIYSKKQYRKLIADLRDLSGTEEPFKNEKGHNIGGTVYYKL